MFVVLVGGLIGEVAMVVVVGLVVGAGVGWCPVVSLLVSPCGWFCRDRRAMVTISMVI